MDEVNINIKDVVDVVVVVNGNEVFNMIKLVTNNIIALIKLNSAENKYELRFV